VLPVTSVALDARASAMATAKGSGIRGSGLLSSESCEGEGLKLVPLAP